MERKKFDLDERTPKFAHDVRVVLKYLPPSNLLSEDRKQLLRSSGSVGANYIEASESLSRKDFLLRIGISKKETMESLYWLRLIKMSNSINHQNVIDGLIQEAKELGKILGAIQNKVRNNIP